MAGAPTCPSCNKQTMVKEYVYNIPRWKCPDDSCGYSMKIMESQEEALKKYVKENPAKKK